MVGVATNSHLWVRSLLHHVPQRLPEHRVIQLSQCRHRYRTEVDQLGFDTRFYVC